MTISFVLGVHFEIASLMSRAYSIRPCVRPASSFAMTTTPCSKVGSARGLWANSGGDAAEIVAASVVMITAVFKALQTRFGALSFTGFAEPTGTAAVTARASGALSPRAANSAATLWRAAEALADPAWADTRAETAVSRRKTTPSPSALSASARTAGVTAAAMSARA